MFLFPKKNPDLPQRRLRELQARAPPLPDVQARLQAEAAGEERVCGEDFQSGPVKNSYGFCVLEFMKYFSIMNLYIKYTYGFPKEI